VFENIWAKSPTDKSLTGQSLMAHTEAVLDRLQALRARQPNLHILCDHPRLWHWAGVACALHDLGKCAPRFQTMLHGGPRFGERHEVISLALLPVILAGTDPGDQSWIAAGIVSHHRELSRLRQDYDPGDRAMDLPDGCTRLASDLDTETLRQMWQLAIQCLIPAAMRRGLLEPGWQLKAGSIPDSGSSWAALNIRTCLNAVEQLAKRAIGTDKYALACRFLRGLVLLSDHAASAGQPFLTNKALLDPAAMSAALFPATAAENYYKHQAEARDSHGNILLIAPTGTGKTESALLWASNRGTYSEGRPTLFYVLPYQASLNAMRDRLGRSLGESSVVLQHSRALQALYRRLLDRGYSGEEARRTAVKERGLARLYAAPIRITTPYQLLRGAFQLKGHPALWTDAAAASFVIDEIHAYEPVRLGMILEMLSHLNHDLGAACLVMSATLPSILKTQLQAVSNPSCIEASDETYRAFKRHRINLVDDDLLDAHQTDVILSTANDGRSVLVVATTVARAQKIWDILRRRLGPEAAVELLHGRLCARDRFKKENRVLSAVATGQIHNRGVVLVATQVVEVSLNVDFDTLFSDPAPLEALLQRFGRINRRRRLSEAQVHIMSRIPEGSPVYPDHLIRPAIDLLRSANGQMIDESAIQGWLDHIYSGEIGRQWEQEVNRSRRDFRRDVLDTLSVFDSSPELEKRFDDLFDGTELLPASLEREYENLYESDPLLAPGLLVPVSFKQAAVLHRQGRLRRLHDEVRVADVPYDSELGLALGSAAPDGI
jgi:CRISPR-associated endonuclease/helicase Cas3